MHKVRMCIQIHKYIHNVAVVFLFHRANQENIPKKLLERERALIKKKKIKNTDTEPAETSFEIHTAGFTSIAGKKVLRRSHSISQQN